MKFMKDPLVISCSLITIICVGIILWTLERPLAVGLGGRLRGSLDDTKGRTKYQQKMIKSKNKFPDSADLKSR